MSPASGDLNLDYEELLSIEVSIQLMSPASGDLILSSPISRIRGRFHSINVPSEWGLDSRDKFVEFLRANGFHSINVPSEWGQVNHANYDLNKLAFPFN